MLVVIMLFPILLQAQTDTYIQGFIRNSNGQPIPSAYIIVKNEFFSAMSNDSGYYRLKMPAYKPLTVIFYCVGYQNVIQNVRLNPGENEKIDVTLPLNIRNLNEVSVTSDFDRALNLNHISTKDFDQMPNPNGSFETLIKTLPGVSSSNELSSQYSVRGGNFDENLVYVNDVEIVRPFLIRSGQQEGLSFINPDMVSSVKFSAGGFEARYGDKMSSVLDVTYRKPAERFAASVSGSLLEFNATTEGLSKNGKFSHITGVRYKTSQYLLNTLDSKGNYNPAFADVQSLCTWQPRKDLDFSFLGNYAQNQYQFIPETRSTNFGSILQVYNLKVYYDGQELDKYLSALGSFTVNYKPIDKLSLKLINSYYSSYEQETFDIDGQYLINELDDTPDSKTYGDSLLNIGIGEMLNHARNFLWNNTWTTSHIGTYIFNKHLLRWSVEYKHQVIEDHLNEWTIIDSAGYISPYSPTSINLTDFTDAKNKVISSGLSGFLQDTWQFYMGSAKCFLTDGLRLNYWGYTNEWLLSPRARLSIKPNWNRDFMFHFSTGVYDQPPDYKEMRNFQGILNKDIKAQRSYHVVVSSDYNLLLWDRPFKFTSEAYYKYMTNLIPYKIDNIQIRYTALNEAKGYAEGIDFKLNGEFVQGVESWASLSLMKAEEDIKGDSYIDDNGNRVFPGYFPCPTDQRVIFNLFFQDYLPNNPTLQAHMILVYGSPLHISPPNSPRFDLTFPLGPYQRVDMGFSKILRKAGKVDNIKLFNKFKECIVSLEVFNLLNISNTASYLWIRTVSNQDNVPNTFAVPNYLTSRRLNLKVSMKF